MIVCPNRTKRSLVEMGRNAVVALTNIYDELDHELSEAWRGS